MIISLVVAAAENNAIGKNNSLLWSLPNDTKYFKNITWAMPVAMGRKTFEALNSQPLKGRINIVITQQKNFTAKGMIAVNSIDDAVFIAQANHYKELMIIGGGEIYKEALPNAKRIYLTRVHASFEEADAFFPAFDTSKWKLLSNDDYYTDEKHAYNYSFQVWERK